MAGDTPARLWTAWLGDELRRDFRAAEDQVKIARGVWFSGQRQAQDQMEAEAS
jgi:hypothetical protein